MEPGPIQYTLVRDGWVAYQVTGDGPRDLVWIGGFMGSLDVLWENPRTTSFFTHLSTYGRLIMLDHRGCGLSDRLATDASRTEEWVYDTIGVMDAVGSERATLVASDTGTPTALLTAATLPDRVDALLLMQPYAVHPVQLVPADIRDRVQEQTIELFESSWGDGTTIRSVNPDLSPEVAEGFAGSFLGKLERASFQKGEVRANLQAVTAVDVRDALASVRARTLIFHATRNAMVPMGSGREVATSIPGAQLVEIDSPNLHAFLLHPDVVFPEIDRFFGDEHELSRTDRVLTTILFSDIVESTQRAVAEGDRRWRSTLDTHDRIVSTSVSAHNGHVVRSTGDGVLATFDSPARAIRATLQIRDALGALGIQVRQGLHTGEIERRGDDVSGLTVHIAARVGALANSDEILITRTVKDLAAGSGQEFVERGEHALKGVPDRWPLYAVVDES